MKPCTYLNEPGILFDMLDALKLRFNGERMYLPLRGISLAYEENEIFYRLIIDKLSDVSETLLTMFYYDNKQNIDSGVGVYVNTYLDFTPDNIFKEFYDSLRDVNRLKQTIYKNYISSDCPEVFDITSIPLVKDNIFSADLPADMKMYLLNFLLFGENEIEKIIAEFKKAETICRDLHKLYENEKKEVLALYEDNPINELSCKHLFDLSSCDDIYFTFKLIISDSVIGQTYNNTWISLLGLSAAKRFSTKENSFDNINLYELGRILYDETRLKILNMLSEEEMYCAQIAKILGLKNNSTLYHLNMMESEGLLHQRRDRKKVYYIINQRYLNQIKNLIDTKFKGDKEQ